MSAITRLSIKVAHAVLALSCMVGTASAANLYKEGSTPYRMFKVVEPVVGSAVTPVFIMGDQPLRFLADMDYEAVKAAGVKEETLRYYMANLKPESKGFGLVGYAMSGSGVPGNEVKSLTCAIVISSDERMKTTSTMFHESIHCKNFAALRDNPKAWLVAVSFNDPSLGMTDNQFMSLFHEVLAAYMQVAYASNLGLQDGMGMVKSAALPDHNTATSIGFRTARSALTLCAKKDACPTDPVKLVHILAQDPVLKAELTQDIHELYLAAKATGYVVENN